MLSIVRAFLVVSLSVYCMLSTADSLSGHVARVTDGDSIVILVGSNTQYEIHLRGIDAPETGQAYGTKSRQHLSDYLVGKFVIVEYERLDRNGQILGKVLLGDEDMNLEQVRAGLAWHYKGFQGEQSIAERVRYSDAEMDARRHKRGLWADRRQVPPWDYREGEQDRRKAMEPFTLRSETLGNPY